MGHIKMMAATQPFLSGAISKTVNLPNDCSVEDIADAYIESWRLGIKAVAIYRDGSKGAQPLNVSTDDKNKKPTSSAPPPTTNPPRDPRRRRRPPSSKSTKPSPPSATAALASAAPPTRPPSQPQPRTPSHRRPHQPPPSQNSDSLDAKAPPRAVRHRLPAERASVTHKFGLGGHEGYITVGLYPNGCPGEIFIRMAKEGSTVSGLMDSFATAISLALQHGVPLKRPLRKVRPHPLRALRLDRQRADRLRQIHHGLPLPLDAAPLPLRPPSSTSSPASPPRPRVAVAGTVNAPANTVTMPKPADRWSSAPVNRSAEPAPRAGTRHHHPPQPTRPHRHRRHRHHPPAAGPHHQTAPAPTDHSAHWSLEDDDRTPPREA